MIAKEVPFSEVIREVIDNRGKTCPTAEVGIPLIATNCVHYDSLYPTYEKVRFVSQHTYSTWFRGHPEPGDILFVNKATPGRVCLVPDPVDFCIAQDMVAVRADPTKIYPRYLFAVLRSKIVQEKIAQMHVGSLIPHFKKGDFDKLLLPLPSREVQESIGDIYFHLSAKIDLNQRINETLEATARLFFKDWFVDFGPTRAKAEGRPPYLAPELWSLFPDALDDDDKPMGWLFGSLSELSTLNPESWTTQTMPKEIEYVDLSNTKWGQIEQTQTFTRGQAPSRAQRILMPGDTIVGTVRPGNGSYALISEDGLTGSTGFAVLRPKQPKYREVVYLAATSKDNIEALTHLADGAAYPAVRPDVVAAQELVIPDGRCLTAFSATTASIIDMVEGNKAENKTLAQTRDLLLPKLMSGEIRLREAEKLVEKVA